MPPIHRRFASLIVTLVAMATLAEARAEERPVATPTRDVDVIYQSVRPGQAQPLRQRVRWNVAAGLQRVDPPSAGLYLILDYRAHRLLSVRDSIKTVLEIDATGARLMPDPGAGHYQRAGAATVAGLTCAVWQADAPPPAARLCVTDDGVMLRLTAGERVLAEAISVRYGPADPTVFAVPDGYRHIIPGQENPQ